MTLDHDQSVRALAGIATLQPDLARAARTRQRCRAILERHTHAAVSSDAGARCNEAQAAERRSKAPTTAQAAARKALVGVCCILCVVYVLALVLTTAALQGMSR